MTAMKNDQAANALNALTHPVIMLDASNMIVFANNQAENFLQSSIAILKRKSIEHFMPFGSPVLALIDQVRERRAPINEYRIDISSPRLGRDCLVDVYAGPVVESDGHVVLQLHEKSVTDKIERQMMHRTAARSVTGLSAMLAHEIKNPLSGIRGAAQLLEIDCDPNQRELTHLITAETDRIVTLLDRMEVFSDERPTERTPVNIHVVFDRVAAIAKAGFGKNVTFIEKFDPSLPLVHGNHDQLVQVFLNIVKNAVEAVEGVENPTVELSTAFRPGIRLSLPGVKEKVSLPLELCVTDNGPGVAEDLLPFLFDPFITSKTNGSGLGLALVAKIVGDHGGTIECDPQPQRTSFKILMPAIAHDPSNVQGEFL